MSNTRLNTNSRSLLLCLVEQIVDCPAEEKVLSAAYAKALPAAKLIVETRYPARDMAVMTKYECAERCDDIKIQLMDGSVIAFEFDKTDAPSKPLYRRGMFLADDRQSKVLDAWKNAKDDFKKVRDEKRTDYKNFINGAVTFEQVVEVWPEAMQLASQIKTNLPANVGPDVLARITADSKKRMKRAA